VTRPIGGEDQAFARVVARIERILAPLGAVVEMHTHLPDHITGAPVPVEAVIRLDGLTPVVVLVSWQGRRLRPMEPWLDELRTKRELTGADRALALTLGRPGPRAKGTAQRHNVTLMTVPELSDEMIRSFVELPGTSGPPES
jgi:hypothetical protein